MKRYNPLMRCLFSFALAVLMACASVPAGLRAGDRWVEKGRCEEAVEAYAQALAEDPELVDAYLGQGRCHQQMEQLEEAAKAFGQALAREKTERTLVPLARVRTQQGKFDRADALLTQLVALTDDDEERARYQRQLGELRLTAGQVSGAAALLRKVVIQNPEDNEARVLLGRALIETSQYEEALRILNEAFALARESETLSAPLVCEIGRAMEAIERYADALRSFRYCGSLDEGYAPALIGEGRLQRKRRKHEAAIETLQQVVRRFPDDASAHFEFGLALRDYGVYERAVSELEIASSLDPSFDDSYAPLLALLSSEVRDPEKRYAILARAAPVLTESLEIQLEYGRAAARRRELQAAYDALGRAVSLAPGDVEANYYLGVVQAARGQLEDAAQTVEALGVSSPEQALELAEIVNEARKGVDPIRFLGGDSGKSAVGRNVKGRLQKRDAIKRRAAKKRAKRKKRRGKRKRGRRDPQVR